jgi:hypothetical protein
MVKHCMALFINVVSVVIVTLFNALTIFNGHPRMGMHLVIGEYNVGRCYENRHGADFQLIKGTRMEKTRLAVALRTANLAN